MGPNVELAQWQLNKWKYHHFSTSRTLPHPSRVMLFPGAFTWSSFISRTFVETAYALGKKPKGWNDTKHSHRNEDDTWWFRKSSDLIYSFCNLKGILRGEIFTSENSFHGFRDWKTFIVSWQKATGGTNVAFNLKIWCFQNQSSACWQGQYGQCFYIDQPKPFLQPSNFCFPPTIWPRSLWRGKIIFGKQGNNKFCMWNMYPLVN